MDDEDRSATRCDGVYRAHRDSVRYRRSARKMSSPIVAVLPLPAGARNAVDYSAQTAIEHKRGYPDIAPLRLAASPADAFERVARAMRSMGWEVVSEVPGDLRVEAADATRLFGFKDDVVRNRPASDGSVIDVRSLTRVGGSDFGLNARRVRTLLSKVGEGTPS